MRFDHAWRVLEDGLATGAYGGAVAQIVQGDAVLADRQVGEAQRGQESHPITIDTIFDLASLTKVVAGLTAVLLLLDRGALALGDTVARFIPEFARHGKGGVTIRHLLTHSSGLPAWVPLYLTARTTEEALPVLCDLELEAAPGSRVVYSDLGMALVAYLVQVVAREPMAALLAREVFDPLGMVDTGYLPSPAQRARCAATAVGNEHESALLERTGERFDRWRAHLLVGEVHDGNAHYALGGVSSHAGLFSTAGDLGRFARMYLGHGAFEGRQILSPASIQAATHLHTPHLNLRYGLGWRIVDHAMAQSPAPVLTGASARYLAPEPAGSPPPIPSMGDLVSELAYGHTGFTGVSLVIDPSYDLAMILLTNAVHTDPSLAGIGRVRPRFHNAVCAAVGDALY